MPPELVPPAHPWRVHRGRASTTHTARQIVGLVLAGLTIGSIASANDAAVLIACSGHLARATAHLVRVRERVLSQCIVETHRCPDAVDACLGTAGRRCRTRLGHLAEVAAAVAHSGDRCAARLGGRFLDEDGLGYALLGPYCPPAPDQIDGPSDALGCQRRALDCTADRTIAVLEPRAAETLARIGVTSDDALGCLTASTCGDGVLDETEECDQGTANSDTLPDHCRTSCREPVCGDGVVDEDEECDDGNVVDGDGCDADCFGESDACGNGIVDADEECDDGNTVDGDGCDSDCTVDTSICGDGIESDNEECDDGAANSDMPDHCRPSCRLPSCGDGIVDPGDGEECEPPGTLLCTADCEQRVKLPLDRVEDAGTQVEGCERGILRAGLRVFTSTRVAVGGCVQAAGRCVLGNDSDRCLTAAAQRCATAAARRDRTRATAGAAVAHACRIAGGTTALPLATLLDPRTGLGFRDVAAQCPFADARPPGPEDLFACLLDRAVCLGERTVAQAVPRAYDFLDEVIDDAEDTFPCVSDPQDLAASPSGAFVDATRPRFPGT
jgi:cysteine-rich repeat protein